MSEPVRAHPRAGTMKILAALIVVAIASSFSPVLGVLLCIAAFAVSVVAIIYPLPSIGMPTRKFSFCVLIFVGFFGTTIPALMMGSEKDKGNPDPVELSQEQKNKDEFHAARAREIAEAEAARRVENSERAKQTLQRAIDEGRWYSAGLAFAETGPSERDEAFMSEIETRAAALIKALPASDTEANKNGYEFLALLQPENRGYAEKAAKYREKDEDEKAQAVKRAEQERQAVLSKLIKKEDKIEGVTFFTHPAAPKHLNSRSTAYLYIGRSGQGTPNLRMKVQYTASDWLFVENVYAWFDGIKEPLISGPFERDNNATIWEWRDVEPDGRQLLTLESLANAKEAILRFEGSQYRKDVILSASDRKAIREVLAAYEAMRTGG